MTNPDNILKSRDITLPIKVKSSQGYGFSSGHVWMWEVDYKESWAQKNWCFWIVVLEKTLESTLDFKKIQPIHPKGDKSWVFNGRNDVEAETPILWLPHAKSWLIGKDPDAEKDWGWKEKGTTEDEMVGWHHQLNGHGFGWTLGVGDGQGGLACCDSWGRKESGLTERLNGTELNNSKWLKAVKWIYQEDTAFKTIGNCMTIWLPLAQTLPGLARSWSGWDSNSVPTSLLDMEVPEQALLVIF